MMTSEKHTPGPWARHPIVAQIDAFDQEYAIPVCQLLWPTELRSEQETEANGHLIAAAPDMYEALKGFNLGPDAIVGAQGNDIIMRVPTSAIAQAAAAIAKAKGRS